MDRLDKKYFYKPKEHQGALVTENYATCPVCGCNQFILLDVVETEVMGHPKVTRYPVCKDCLERAPFAAKQISEDDYRKGVKALFGGECQICGAKAREMHHIRPRKEYPELANILFNGLPLCTKCHHLVHKRRKERQQEMRGAE